MTQKPTTREPQTDVLEAYTADSLCHYFGLESGFPAKLEAARRETGKTFVIEIKTPSGGSYLKPAYGDDLVCPVGKSKPVTVAEMAGMGNSFSAAADDGGDRRIVTDPVEDNVYDHYHKINGATAPGLRMA